MKEYVEREALLEEIIEPWKRIYEQCTYQPVNDLYRMIMKRIKRAPAVDVEPVRHGEWVKTPYIEVKRCSCCEKPSNISKGIPNYCPNCGAKMDGGNK